MALIGQKQPVGWARVGFSMSCLSTILRPWIKYCVKRQWKCRIISR